MERAANDPLQQIIADPCRHSRPIQYYREAIVLDIDLEAISESLIHWLSQIYTYDRRIVQKYAIFYEYDEDDDVDYSVATLREDFKALVDIAIAVAYNRLREVLEMYCITALFSPMDLEAPVDKRFEFPNFMSATLGSIGPIMLDDCAIDRLIVYSTTADRMENFGRKAPPNWDFVGYERILNVLKGVGVEMSPIDFNYSNFGKVSCFPTIRCNVREGLWSLYGTVHKSHYENEDIAKAMFVCSPGTEPAFEDVRFPAKKEEEMAADAATLGLSIYAQPTLDIQAGNLTKICNMSCLTTVLADHIYSHQVLQIIHYRLIPQG